MIGDERWVVITWNQASHQPHLAVDILYDDKDDAIEVRDAERAATARVGRRERHTVHCIDLSEDDEEYEDVDG